MTIRNRNENEYRVLEESAYEQVDASTNTDKFWHASLEQHLNPSSTDAKKPWVVFLHWGKNGTAGQRKDKRYTSESAARAYYTAGVRDKEGKGYSKKSSQTHVAPPPKAAPTKAIKFVSTDWDL
jgi:predicted DNA-binding WGR domain protein